jgi:general secretion pathway protein D
VGLQWVRYRYVRRRISHVLLVGVLLAPPLVGCTSTDKSIPMPDAVDPVRNADFKARFPLADDHRNDATAGASRYLIVPGADGERSPSTPARDAGASERVAASDVTATAPGGRIEINLDNADIPTAARTLLGDILHLNYVIDPRVQGTVSLASVGPIDRKDVLPIFENVLRMSNAVIVRDADLVKIVPALEAAGSGSFSAGVGPAGFGVSVVPLHYASAAAIAKTTENFLSRPSELRADPMHNLILIQGTKAERQGLIDVISAFDVEWLRNQSVGLYPLKATQPETMIQELDRIFETSEGGQGQGVIRFQPISRMNAVMVVAKSPKLLERATHWIDRLDRADSSGQALRVYRLKNADARQVAKIMSELFVNRGGNAETPFSQLTPGATANQSRLDALGTSGSGGTGGGLGTSASASGGAATGAGAGAGGSALGTANKSTSTSFQSFFDHAQNEDKDSSSLSAGNLPRGLFQNVRITADVSNNSIVIYSNLEDFRIIEHALHDIDQPKLQVAIEATVAEVTLTDALQYGVQSFLTSGNLNMGPDKGSVGLFPAAPVTNPTTTTTTTGTSTTTTTATVAATQFLSRVLPGFNLLLGPEAQPSFILSALATLTEVKVLSSPSLVALDDQPAMIEVGQDIPITTSSATLLANSGTPIVNTIDMRSTGVILKILPHIHANGTVQLEVEQEISNVVNPNQQTLTPTISERRVRSTIVVTNGQTVMLGGLISEQTDNTKSGVPGINQIQYLGDLLGTTSKNKQRQEIIIFIKPQVIRNTVDMQSTTEEFRQRLQSMHASDSVREGNAGAAALNPRKN